MVINNHKLKRHGEIVGAIQSSVSKEFQKALKSGTRMLQA